MRSAFEALSIALVVVAALAPLLRRIALRRRARIGSRDAERLRFTVPLLPGRLEGAASERALLDELERFAQDSELGVVEVLRMAEAGKDLVHRWSVRPASDVAARDMVFATYPLGPDATARGSLRFGWRSDLGDVSPQSEILLQVATDQVAAHLARMHSALAPREGAFAPREGGAETRAAERAPARVVAAGAREGRS